MALPGKQPNGFTLVEIITVFLLVSILSVAMIGRFVDNDTELVAGTQVLKTHLRYAQSRAMSTASTWYVSFDTTTAPGTYALYWYVDGTADTSQVFPGETDATVALISGMTIPDGNGAVAGFDRLGRPYTDAAGTTAQSGLRNLVTRTSDNSTLVQIKPETGFIP